MRGHPGINLFQSVTILWGQLSQPRHGGYKVQSQRCSCRGQEQSHIYWSKTQQVRQVHVMQN